MFDQVSRLKFKSSLIVQYPIIFLVKIKNWVEIKTLLSFSSYNWPLTVEALDLSETALPVGSTGLGVDTVPSMPEDGDGCTAVFFPLGFFFSSSVFFFFSFSSLVFFFFLSSLSSFFFLLSMLGFTSKSDGPRLVCSCCSFSWFVSSFINYNEEGFQVWWQKNKIRLLNKKHDNKYDI